MPRKQNVTADIQALSVKLENRAKSSRRAGLSRMERGHDLLRDLAVMYAPEDEGNLSEAIKKRKSRTGINGRNIYEVYVDESAIGSNGAATVGKYAVKIHESFDYQLGKGSLAKDEDVGGNGLGYPFGGKVGPKFLDRAMSDSVAKINRAVRDAISKELK